MPRFEIKGKGRETGRPRKRVFKAENEQQARALAETEGFVVESATLLPDASPEKQSTRKKSVATKKRSGLKKAAPKPPPSKAVEPTATKGDAGAGETQERPLPPSSRPEAKSVSSASQRPSPEQQGEPPPAGHLQGKEPIAGPRRPASSGSGEEQMPPWIGLREGRGGCLPVLIGGLGLGLLYLLQLQVL